jgi:hypothetical protein
MSANDLEQLFQEGIAAVRAGDKAAAREKLMKVVEANQLHEQGWLWLSAVVETDEDRIVCLQNVLTVNPKNEVARKGLIKLGGEIPNISAAPPAAPIPAGMSKQPAVEKPYWADSADDLIGSKAPPQSETHPLAPADGLPKPQAPVTVIPGAPDPELKPGEEWRLKISADDYKSDGTIVRDLHEPQEMVFNDLVKAWLSALYFRVQGPYENEVRWGSVMHILLNIVVGVILQVVAVLLPLGILLALGQSPSSMFGDTINDINQSLREAGNADISQIAPAPLRPALQFLSQSGSGMPIGQIPASLVASLGTFVLIYVIATILLTFVSILFRGWVTNMVADWLGGKGDVIMTTQALSIAYAVTGAMRIPVFSLAAFFPGGFVLANGLMIVYEFVQAGVAVQAAHQQNILVSLGIVIFSGVLSGAILVGLSCCLVFVLGMGRG